MIQRGLVCRRSRLMDLGLVQCGVLLWVWCSFSFSHHDVEGIEVRRCRREVTLSWRWEEFSTRRWRMNKNALAMIFFAHFVVVF